MAEQLKEMFNEAYFKKLAHSVSTVYPKFKADVFLSRSLENLQLLSLNERLRNTSTILKIFLPEDFNRSVEILRNVATLMPSGYTSLVFPDYIGQYGIKYFEESMDALKYFTSFGSSEFAIREFLKIDFEKTLLIMKQWAQDDNFHVRRLASEGSRPKLPWSFHLPEVINDPNHTLQILDTLKADVELYVRKSVANHLNDISKDHPEWFLEIAASWIGKNTHTDWVIKHASRTLLKAGHKDIFKLFGLKDSESIKLQHFKIAEESIRMGEKLNFSVELQNTSPTSCPVRIEFALHFLRQGNTWNKKVFKIAERTLDANDTVNWERHYDFKPISTRKYYNGIHFIELIVNGISFAKLQFNVI